MTCVLGRRFGTISTPAKKKSTVVLSAARNVLTVKLRDHTYSADEEEDRGFPIEKTIDAWERRSFFKSVCCFVNVREKYAHASIP